MLLGPPGTGKTHLSIALGIRACLAGHRVAFKTATEWVALLADAQRHGRLDAELDKLQRVAAADRRRGRLHPVRSAGRKPHVHARLQTLRTRLADRHQQQALLSLGRHLRRRDHRRRDDRPPRSPRRNPRAQGRQLPPQGSRPRPHTAGSKTDPPHDGRARRSCYASAYGLGSAAPARTPARWSTFQPALPVHISPGLDRRSARSARTSRSLPSALTDGSTKSELEPASCAATAVIPTSLTSSRRVGCWSGTKTTDPTGGRSWGVADDVAVPDRADDPIIARRRPEGEP